jgi:hypothetical protein
MKRLISLTFVILFLAITAFTSNYDKVCIFEEKESTNYCQGWRDGYIDGYCYLKSPCVHPLPPICPVRRINEDDNYSSGYKRGFLNGKSRQ